jgi:hypothetical protein
MSWNVSLLDDRNYVLLNEDETEVRLSKRVPQLVLAEMLSQLEEKSVPIGYTRDLESIYFTLLPPVSGALIMGDYFGNNIRLSYHVMNRNSIARTFIHELGHHVDDMEAISEEFHISHERKNKKKFMKNEAAKDSDSEYVAVGFEIFYFGSDKEKKLLKRHNRKLFDAISDVHEKYKRR